MFIWKNSSSDHNFIIPRMTFWKIFLMDLLSARKLVYLSGPSINIILPANKKFFWITWFSKSWKCALNTIWKWIGFIAGARPIRFYFKNDFFTKFEVFEQWMLAGLSCPKVVKHYHLLFERYLIRLLSIQDWRKSRTMNLPCLSWILNDAIHCTNGSSGILGNINSMNFILIPIQNFAAFCASEKSFFWITEEKITSLKFSECTFSNLVKVTTNFPLSTP